MGDILRAVKEVEKRQSSFDCVCVVGGGVYWTVEKGLLVPCTILEMAFLNTGSNVERWWPHRRRH